MRLQTHKDPNEPFAYPRVHGLVFDPADGILHRLEMNEIQKSINKNSHIFNLFKQ